MITLLLFSLFTEYYKGLASIDIIKIILVTMITFYKFIIKLFLSLKHVISYIIFS